MDTSTHTSPRNEPLDAIKAFAIICVVLGHCIQYGSGHTYLAINSFYDNLLFKAIYSFHMPLFMLLSGYFFGYSVKKRAWYDSIITKIKYLIIPILSWSFIRTLLLCFFSYRESSTIPGLNYGFQVYSQSALTEYWFLWAVFYCSALVAIVHHFLNDSPIVYCLLFVISFILPDVRNFGLYFYKFMYPFFIIGYFYSTRHLSIISQITKRRIIVISLVLAYFVLLALYNRDSFIYTTGHTILKNGSISLKQLSIDLYRIIIGLCGSIIAIFTIMAIYPSFTSSIKWIASYLGRNTLGIYIIQGFIVVYMSSRLTAISGFSVLRAFLECIVVLFISILVLESIKKSKLLSMVFLGTRSKSSSSTAPSPPSGTDERSN